VDGTAQLIAGAVPSVQASGSPFGYAEPQLTPAGPQHQFSSSSWHDGIPLTRDRQQAVPLPQTTPHAPQLFGSVPVFVQVLPHFVSPEGQPHTPPLHAGRLLGHTLPQPPQLFGSEATVVQVLPHFVSPEGQPHTPPLHVGKLLGHTSPQAPQLFGSVPVLLQMPLHPVSPEGQAQAPSRSRYSVSQPLVAPSPQGLNEQLDPHAGAGLPK
jgi:hypothetical protein